MKETHGERASNEDRVCKERVKRSVFKCGQDAQEVFSSHLINRTLYTKEVIHFISTEIYLGQYFRRTLFFYHNFLNVSILYEIKNLNFQFFSTFFIFKIIIA